MASSDIDLDYLTHALQSTWRNGNGKGEPEVVNVVNVVRHPGQQIQLPEGLTLIEGALALARKAVDEEQLTDFSASIDASPYDGAHAFYRAMEALFCVTTHKTL